MRPEHPGSKAIVWRRRGYSAIAMLLIAGCTSMAAHTPANYERGAVTQEKFDKDTDSCARQAEAHTKQYGMGPYDPTHGSYNFMYDSCMQASGYARKKPAP
jgi:hypothetical protein